MELRDRKMTAGEAILGLCQMSCVSTGGADRFTFGYWRLCFMEIVKSRTYPDLQRAPISRLSSWLLLLLLLLLSPVAGATVCTAAMRAFCIIPTLEVPTCTARNPHANDARGL
jgi:hypothetical protein